ncbi:glyoxalase [Actinomadura sp. ATCC 31491]|uniref:Glyoxalase n=1 Tax=Actinomadura luzonensis TaxID=2805427 RepID=A0ABT0FXC4_9ACTN|nr:glyoxalase [Actinomadura luzonensis]MCK2217002.1 glyoxalase [Actinomadura luzonensis]
MASIEFAVLGVADLPAATRFHADVLGSDPRIRLQAAHEPTSGFRGFTLSLLASQPADVDALVEAALGAGAATLKPVTKSLWGYGGVVQAPDGTICTVACSAKKNTGPATTKIDDLVLQLGVADVAAGKRFYTGRGLAATKSYGRRYVEFAAPSSPLKLSLYKRRALAKVAGVAPDGDGSHRLVIGSDAGPFTDPDGFVWEATPSSGDVAG